MKYVPIGELTNIEKEVYKCIEHSKTSNCGACDFDVIDVGCFNCYCSACKREDGENVIFVLYDDISEDSEDE